MSSFTCNATIVLVHGAWADGSCWQNVILPLRNNGLQAPKLQPDGHGFIWMPESGFAHAVAHKASPDQTMILEAVQRPIAMKCIQEKAPAPAWKRSDRGSCSRKRIA